MNSDSSNVSSIFWLTGNGLVELYDNGLGWLRNGILFSLYNADRKKNYLALYIYIYNKLKKLIILH